MRENLFSIELTPAIRLREVGAGWRRDIDTPTIGTEGRVMDGNR